MAKIRIKQLKFQEEKYPAKPSPATFNVFLLLFFSFFFVFFNLYACNRGEKQFCPPDRNTLRVGSGLDEDPRERASERFRAETRLGLSTRFSLECGVSIEIVAGSMLRVLTLKDGRGMPVS